MQAGHSIIVHGDNRLAAATAAQLRDLGASVVQVAGGAEHLLGAGIAEAGAVVLCAEDDLGNLNLALAIYEARPELHLVVRLFNLDLGAQIQSLVPSCRALSASQLAAPVFVEAALADDFAQRITVEGHDLEVVNDHTAFLCLADAHGVLPDEAAGECVMLSEPARRPLAALRHRRAPNAGATLRAFAADRRVRSLVAVLTALIVVSITVFALERNRSLLGASVDVVSAASFGDASLADAPGWLQIYGIALMLVGTGCMAVLFALITDAVITTRLSGTLGAVPRRMKGHAVVCGLGSVGHRIAAQLAADGVPVVAVDKSAGSQLIGETRRLGVAAAIGDAALPETLRSLSIERASYLFCVTNDDNANLATALTARAANPDLRIVMRLMDADFAERVERVARLGVSRSLSQLAAPAFAAAAFGRDVSATIRTDHGPLLVAGVSGLAGSVAEFENRGGVRVLAFTRDGHTTWRPEPLERLSATDAVTVVATPYALADLPS
jgi:Trk K+ transport system NAD-binding subunit